MSDHGTILEYLINTDASIEWDVLYLLEEYGQSVKEKKGCLARLIKFFGVDEKVLLAEGHEGEGKYGDYWYM